MHNVDRRVEPLDALPVPAFDLTDFDAYEKLSGARKIGYATSVGCPSLATTAPTWSFTSADSMRFPPNALFPR